jgi:hypothetical protein
MINSKLVQTVNQEVYRRFPQLDGISPKVEARPGQGGAAKQTAYCLIYSTNVAVKSPGKAQGGSASSLPWLVRVLVDDQGKILKITTSR